MPRVKAVVLGAWATYAVTDVRISTFCLVFGGSCWRGEEMTRTAIGGWDASVVIPQLHMLSVTAVRLYEWCAALLEMAEGPCLNVTIRPLS